MANTPLISFVVPVRNDARHLSACLCSIIADAPSRGRVEIIVADNGSTDSSPDVALSAGARVLSLPGLTVAELRNRAAQKARGAAVAFVDADHQIDAGWTRSAIEALAEPGIVAVGAPYHAPRNGTWVQRMYDSFRDHADGRADVGWLGSGNLVVKRDAFLAVGGFDTGLVTCEDVDLCQRLRRRGGRIVRDARLRTIHFGDPATLSALFFGELWRGRDNVRASLRSLSVKGLPSLAIPVVDLLLMATAAFGLVAAPHGGLRATALAVAGISLLAGLRTAIMVTRLRTVSLSCTAQALAVALTYDVARALAPIWSGPHAARRRAEAR